MATPAQLDWKEPGNYIFPESFSSGRDIYQGWYLRDQDINVSIDQISSPEASGYALKTAANGNYPLRFSIITPIPKSTFIGSAVDALVNGQNVTYVESGDIGLRYQGVNIWGKIDLNAPNTNSVPFSQNKGYSSKTKYSWGGRDDWSVYLWGNSTTGEASKKNPSYMQLDLHQENIFFNQNGTSINNQKDTPWKTISGYATDWLDINNVYRLSGWYAKTADSTSNSMFNVSVDGQETSYGLGVLQDTKEINGLTWERRSQLINPKTTKDFTWNIGKDTQPEGKTGNQYFTGLKVQKWLPEVTITGLPQLSISKGQDAIEGEQPGWFDIQVKSGSITNQTGIYVRYLISGGTATTDQDFYSSKLTQYPGECVAENVIWLPQGATEGRIYVSAVGDAIAEGNEDVTIQLALNDTMQAAGCNSSSQNSNESIGQNYTLEGYTPFATSYDPTKSTATIQIQDKRETSKNIFAEKFNPSNLFGGLAFNSDTTTLQPYGNMATSAAMSADNTIPKSPAGGIPLKMVTSSLNNFSSTYNQPKYNLGPVKNGQTWTASIYAKGGRDIANNPSGYLYLFEANANGNPIDALNQRPGGYTKLESIKLTNDWKRYEITKQINSPNTTALQLRFDGPGSQTIWWDGIQVEEGNKATNYVDYKSINPYTPGISITPINRTGTSTIRATKGQDGSQSASFEININSQPTSTVSIALTAQTISKDNALTTNTTSNFSQSQLVFDETNWNIPQTITLSTIPDSRTLVTATPSSSDPNYQNVDNKKQVTQMIVPSDDDSTLIVNLKEGGNTNLNPPEVSVIAISGEEGQNIGFKFNLSKPSAQDTVVNYTLSPSSGFNLQGQNSDLNGSTDLDGSQPGTVTIPAFETSFTKSLSTVDDAFAEGAETLTLTLQNGSGNSNDYTVSSIDNSATAKLKDNEKAGLEFVVPYIIKVPSEENPDTLVEETIWAPVNQINISNEECDSKTQIIGVRLKTPIRNNVTITLSEEALKDINVNVTPPSSEGSSNSAQSDPAATDDDSADSEKPSSAKTPANNQLTFTKNNWDVPQTLSLQINPAKKSEIKNTSSSESDAQQLDGKQSLMFTSTGTDTFYSNLEDKLLIAPVPKDAQNITKDDGIDPQNPNDPIAVLSNGLQTRNSIIQAAENPANNTSSTLTISLQDRQGQVFNARQDTVVYFEPTQLDVKGTEWPLSYDIAVKNYLNGLKRYVEEGSAVTPSDDPNGITGSSEVLRGKDLVTWKGFLYIPETGEYTFNLTRSGGAKLSVDGNILIDDLLNNEASNASKTSQPYEGSAGTFVPIELNYDPFEQSPNIDLEWNRPSQLDTTRKNESIPSNYFSQVGAWHVVIPKNSSSTTLTISPRNDDIAKPDQTVKVSLVRDHSELIKVSQSLNNTAATDAQKSDAKTEPSTDNATTTDAQKSDANSEPSTGNATTTDAQKSDANSKPSTGNATTTDTQNTTNQVDTDTTEQKAVNTTFTLQLDNTSDRESITLQKSELNSIKIGPSNSHLAQNEDHNEFAAIITPDVDKQITIYKGSPISVPAVVNYEQNHTPIANYEASSNLNYQLLDKAVEIGIQEDSPITKGNPVNITLEQVSRKGSTYSGILKRNDNFAKPIILPAGQSLVFKSSSGTKAEPLTLTLARDVSISKGSSETIQFTSDGIESALSSEMIQISLVSLTKKTNSTYEARFKRVGTYSEAIEIKEDQNLTFVSPYDNSKKITLSLNNNLTIDINGNATAIATVQQPSAQSANTDVTALIPNIDELDMTMYLNPYLNPSLNSEAFKDLNMQTNFNTYDISFVAGKMNLRSVRLKAGTKMNFGIKNNSTSDSDPNCSDSSDSNQQNNSGTAAGFSLLLTDSIILESELREPPVSVVDVSTVQGTIDNIASNNLKLEKSHVNVPQKDYTITIQDQEDEEAAIQYSISNPGGNPKSSPVTSQETINLQENGAGETRYVKLLSQPTESVTLYLETDTPTEAKLQKGYEYFQGVAQKPSQTNIIESIRKPARENNSDFLKEAVYKLNSSKKIQGFVVNYKDSTVKQNISRIDFIRDVDQVTTSANNPAGLDFFTIREKIEPLKTNLGSKFKSKNFEADSLIAFTFSPSNWDSEQPFTIVPVDDLIDDGTQEANIYHRVISKDTEYQAITPYGVNANNEIALKIANENDDTARLLMNLQKDPISEDKSAFIDLRLNSQPGADVIFTLQPSDEQFTINDRNLNQSDSITFTSENWQLPQTIEIKAYDDDIMEDMTSSQLLISSESKDEKFGSELKTKPISVEIKDNDLPTASIVPVSDAEETGEPGRFRVKLSNPAPLSVGSTGIIVQYTINKADGKSSVVVDENFKNNVLKKPSEESVPISDIAQSPAQTGEVRIAPGQTSSDVFVVPIDEKTDAGDASFTVSLIDPSESASAQYQLDQNNPENSSATLKIMNDDIAGFYIIHQGNVISAVEGGDNTEFLIGLLTQPTAPVKIQILEDLLNHNNTSPQQLDLSTPVEVNYLPSNWSRPQTISLKAFDDGVIEDGAYTADELKLLTYDSEGVVIDDNGSKNPSNAQHDGIHPAAIKFVFTSTDPKYNSNNQPSTSSSSPSKVVSTKITTGGGAAVEQTNLALTDQTIPTPPSESTSFTDHIEKFTVKDKGLPQTTSDAISSAFDSLQDGLTDYQLPMIGKSDIKIGSDLYSFVDKVSSKIKTIKSATTAQVQEIINKEIETVLGDKFRASVLNVNTDANSLTTKKANSFETGDVVSAYSTETLPAGLSNANLYYVIKKAGNTIQLANSLDNAQSNNPLNITGPGSGLISLQKDNSPVKVKMVGNDVNIKFEFSFDDANTIPLDANFGIPSLNFKSQGDLNSSYDVDGELDLYIPTNGSSPYIKTAFNSLVSEINIANNSLKLSSTSSFEVGDRVTLSSSDTLPSGLKEKTEYFVIKDATNNNTLKLAHNINEAIAGQAIDLTSVGSGEITISNPESYITATLQSAISPPCPDRDNTCQDSKITGGLGFLQLEATNANASSERIQGSPATGMGLKLQAFLQNKSTNTQDTSQLTINDIKSKGVSNIIDYSIMNYRDPNGNILAPSAVMSFDVQTSVQGNAAIPSFNFDMAANLPFANGQSSTLFVDNVKLDLGTFVTQLVDPVVSQIDTILEPIYPVVDALYADTHIFGKLGLTSFFDQSNPKDNRVSVMDLAQWFANLGSPARSSRTAKFRKAEQFIRNLKDLTDLVRTLETMANQGNYYIDYPSSQYDFGDTKISAKKNPVKASTPTKTPKQQTTLSNVPSQYKQVMEKLEKLNFKIPLLEDASTIQDLISGETTDLITWVASTSTPPNDNVQSLNIDSSIRKSFPMGPVQGVIEGGFNAKADLTFGFDTSGIKAWQADNFDLDNAWKAFNGFYVNDRHNGVDSPEFQLNANMGAGAGLNAFVARADVTGGIEANASLDLLDGGEIAGTDDGKIYGNEIIERIDNPLSLFEMVGDLAAYLEAKVQIGIDLWFYSYWKTVWQKKLARIPLFKFGLGGSYASGTASNGYLEGSKVFFDANFDGWHNGLEPSMTTGENAQYNLDIDSRQFDINRNGEIDPSEGRLVLYGGIDQTMDQPLKIPFIAPAGDMITPLTTLHSLALDLGYSADEGMSKIKKMFNLGKFNYLQEDPLSHLKGKDLANTKKAADYLSGYVAHLKIHFNLDLLLMALDQLSEQHQGSTQEQLKVMKRFTQSLLEKPDLTSSDTAIRVAILETLKGLHRDSNPGLQKMMESTSTFLAKASSELSIKVDSLMQQDSFKLQDINQIKKEAFEYYRESLSSISHELHLFDDIDSHSEEINRRLSRINEKFIKLSKGNILNLGNRKHQELLGAAGEDYFNGADGDDTIHGKSGIDYIKGGNHNDYIDGGSSNDILKGENGDDKLLGRSGNDHLGGSNGFDQLRGHAGDDQLHGGKNNDTLNGGPGNDILTGGRGKDTFIWSQGRDKINDFQTKPNNSDQLVINPNVDITMKQRGDNLILKDEEDNMTTLLGVDKESFLKINPIG